jgi:putative ubiquitin-RnfH superfamily antitoxin RatB of RatAB toxin-antitoxin module
MDDVHRPQMAVTVVCSPGPREVQERQLRLPVGSTALQALQASGLLQQFAELATGELQLGIWGRKARPGQLLRDRDRVEIYRPLAVDPKVARRQRFVKQGIRTAGLFSKPPVKAASKA